MTFDDYQDNYNGISKKFEKTTFKVTQSNTLLSKILKMLSNLNREFMNTCTKNATHRANS